MLAGSATFVVAAGVMFAFFAGCASQDVDLGGTTMPEASTSLSYGYEAGAIANLCDPCATGLNTCPGGSFCGVLPSDQNTYCFTRCPSGNECGDGESCTLGIISDEGETRNACLPNTNSCGAAPPLVIDGTMPERCGPLSGPTAEANCDRCPGHPSSCQENGCYAGQWCDTRNGQCYDPPSTCP